MYPNFSELNVHSHHWFPKAHFIMVFFWSVRHCTYPDNEAVKRPEISPRIEYLIEASNFPCPEMLGTFFLAFSRALPEEGSFRDSLVQ